MFKLKQMILTICFVLFGALCHANGVTKTQNEKDGHQVSIELTQSTSQAQVVRTKATPLLH